MYVFFFYKTVQMKVSFQQIWIDQIYLKIIIKSSLLFYILFLHSLLFGFLWVLPSRYQIIYTWNIILTYECEALAWLASSHLSLTQKSLTTSCLCAFTFLSFYIPFFTACSMACCIDGCLTPRVLLLILLFHPLFLDFSSFL